MLPFFKIHSKKVRIHKVFRYSWSIYPFFKIRSFSLKPFENVGNLHVNDISGQFRRIMLTKSWKGRGAECNAKISKRPWKNLVFVVLIFHEVSVMITYSKILTPSSKLASPIRKINLGSVLYRWTSQYNVEFKRKTFLLTNKLLYKHWLDV